MEDAKVRIAVFGSFYRGYFVLDELLNGALKDHFHLVGVATDDVTQPFINAKDRVWQYPHSPSEETMVESLAARNGIPIYKGRVKCDGFYEDFQARWRPELCISATFGQRISAPLFTFPRLGFFNIHPCIDDGWPSKYAGPNPFKALMADAHDHARAALHRVDAGFDTGALIALSERIAMPAFASVVDMHKLTSPTMAKFAVQTLFQRVVQANVSPARCQPLHNA